MTYSEVDIRRILNSSPRYRGHGIPNSQNGTIVCFFDEDHYSRAKYIFDGLADRPQIALLNTDEGPAPLSARLNEDVVSFAHAKKQVARDVVICNHEAEYKRYRYMIRRLSDSFLGRTHFYISKAVFVHPHPRLLERERDRILEVVNSLADEESVLCYLARLKMLITGDTGFLRISSYNQYEHPRVKAQPGDTVLDAGVGESGAEIKMFSKSVGPTGRVVSFEPIRVLRERASEEIADLSNAEIVPFGLWSEATQVEMIVAGVSSRITAHGDQNTDLCNLVTVDSMVAEKGLSPSLIKMDIEGAERHAIRGADETIKKNSPKLQVAIYHNVEDFLSIPLIVRAINPGYELFIGHHTPYPAECDLYALPPT